MITYNSQYFEMDGEPWFPVMGEYPYSRSDCRDWKEDLAKMKALGVDIVSSYCCWIHHEEAKGILISEAAKISAGLQKK